MNIKIVQIASLDKVFANNKKKYTEIFQIKALCGERIEWQVMVTSDESTVGKVLVESEIAKYVKVYCEKNACCDMPTYVSRWKEAVDEDYLTFEPCLIPDILEPLEATQNKIRLSENPYLLWVRVDVPKDIEPGIYKTKIHISDGKENTQTASMPLKIIDCQLPKLELKYTQWFYNDCIASYYDAEIYSEKHWNLIDSFIKNAADCGINMLLSPVHNPPLDTAVGIERPNVQLVKIQKSGENYVFDFSRFERWVSICQKYGIEYYEIPHFFSQWGVKSAPNIYVDGVHAFGTHVASDADSYKEFLNQYLPALILELKKLKIYENTFFHISDEPHIEHLDNYEKCRNILKSIAGDLRTIDALSDIEFYKKGLIKIPIPASRAIEPFLKEEIEERWVYYCCNEGNRVSNRFIAMSSFRNRMMGTLMYKFGIKGFLQWGYNFYYAENSEYLINPYVTTSADYAFPSGDAFSVYPGKDGALPSIRAFVFYEGLQDMALYSLLEKKRGKDYVVSLIDEMAGKDVRFADLPEDEHYLYRLREYIMDQLEE